jgi:hypothetical protein
MPGPHTSAKFAQAGESAPAQEYPVAAVPHDTIVESTTHVLVTVAGD